MKFAFFILAFLLFSFQNVFAQTNNTPISIRKGFGSYQYYRGNSKLSIKKVAMILEPNEKAYSVFLSARRNNTFSAIVGGVGGFLVGHTLGTIIRGGEPNFALAAIGSGVIFASIPLSLNYNRKAKQAIDLYNKGLTQDY